MKTVQGHYDQFLGPVYSWILGDFEIVVQRNDGFFASINLSPHGNGIAVDLGCGPGCQSLPLARRGFNVLAIDFCQDLLDELDTRKGNAAIHTVCDDLTNFRSHMPEPPELIVCMGDTLVHLPDKATVDAVIDDVCDSLAPRGKFIYAIRDYVSPAPEGPDRFIPIRASDEKIFTCFLDYKDDVVHIHDILHQRVDGEWQTEISDYLKLRLDGEYLNARMCSRGLVISDQYQADGMIVVTAERPE
ncbi:MAG: class I SAM-dependent methyltransferase [Woeseiaceae bacterium]|nr:class I SAM-dependent methyltransferase [Woeseiaceae bacterium]